MYMLTDRQTKIITPSGLTNPITIKSGIEQGDPLSPIIWKIYYDPILTHIMENYEADLLTIKATQPEQIITSNNQHSISTKIPPLAFMDDTVFISKSKEGIERIASIANKLY